MPCKSDDEGWDDAKPVKPKKKDWLDKLFDILTKELMDAENAAKKK